MNLKTVLENLKISDSEDVLSADSAPSRETLPGKEISFLTPEYLRWACGATYLPGEMAWAVIAAGRRMAEDKSISAFAWYCHQSLFCRKIGTKG